MMRKKCSTFHRCTLRGLNFIETVHELFDNPSYMCINLKCLGVIAYVYMYM